NQVIPFQMEPDAIGLYRVYPRCPTLFPWTTLDTLCDNPLLQTHKDPSNALSQPHTGPPLPFSITPKNMYSAFSSPTAGLLMCWQYSSSNFISNAAVQRLTTFLDDNTYDRRDVRNF
ncbi:hypothetical protein DFH29DRAFT_762981, partial [Suillus ampliporus]